MKVRKRASDGGEGSEIERGSVREGESVREKERKSGSVRALKGCLHENKCEGER